MNRLFCRLGFHAYVPHRAYPYTSRCVHCGKSRDDTSGWGV